MFARDVWRALALDFSFLLFSGLCLARHHSSLN
jgi:hypothetical protein